MSTNIICGSVYTSSSTSPRFLHDHSSFCWSLISVVRRGSAVPPPFFGRNLPRPSDPLSINRPLLHARTTPSAGAVLHDAGATAGTLIGAYGLVYAFNKLTDFGIIEQSLSRKLVHISSGLLFMASWPIFSTSAGAPYFAAFVPLVNCLRLLFYGLSLARDEGLIKSVTRKGNPAELLRGPLYYVLILILCTLVFWRESPVGVIALAMMCGGDGIADIIGRRFGAQKLFYNQHKSWAGSISMFLFGFLTSVGMVYYFSALGYFRLDWALALQRIAIVSLVATVVESLPVSSVVDDNISVPLSSILDWASWKMVPSMIEHGAQPT